MKKFTFKSLALMAIMLFTSLSMQAAASKPNNGYSGLVISKVYHTLTKPNGVYRKDAYIEIFNNTHSVLDLAGMYIGLCDTESSCPPGYSVTAMEALSETRPNLTDSVALKQVFRIPTTASAILYPGKTMLFCNCAINHELTGVDLSGADFEVKSNNVNYDTHNDAVPELELVFTFNESTDFLNLTNTEQSVVLIGHDAKFSDPMYGIGKTKGNQYVLAPAYKVIDGVDLLRNKANTGIDVTKKRLVNSIDSGYVAPATTSLYSGQVAYRKIAMKATDRVFLWDTNNSSQDWEYAEGITPRSFTTDAVGVTEATITIPSTGYYAFKAEKPFYGDDDLIVFWTNGSSKKDMLDITYQPWRADTCIAMATQHIVMGKPGEHKIYYSDWKATRSGSSNGAWPDENGQVSINKKRTLYKFVNTDDYVGFEKVTENTTNKSMTVDAEEGYYITLTNTGLGYMATNHGVSGFEKIDWHGATAGMPRIKSCGWASFSHPHHALDFSNVEGLQAYYMSEANADQVTLQEVNGIVPANTALILKGAEGTYDIPYADASAATELSGNLLVAPEKAYNTVSGDYFLGENTETGEVGMVLSSGTNYKFVYAGMAYLPAANVSSSAKFLPFSVNTTDAIQLNTQAPTTNAPAYNLAGQRVNNAYKGIIVSNGKKYLNK